MSAITPNTPKTNVEIPITPGRRQYKRQTKIAGAKPQVQVTAANVDNLTEQNKAYREETERLLIELSRKDDIISQLKDRSKVLTRKFAEHLEASQTNSKVVDDLKEEIKASEIDSEPSKNDSVSSLTESSESESSEVDLSDVQRPTQTDLIAYLAGTTFIVDSFKALDHDIGALRNDTKKDYANVRQQVSPESLRSNLTNYDNLFYAYRTRYEQEYHPLAEIIENLAKLIISAEQATLSEAHKKTFSAYTGMGLTQINAKEDEYKKAVDKCAALYQSLNTLKNNTIDRFKNAVSELNSIDAYIQTSNGGVLATIKYKTGYGQEKVRTFEPHPKKLEAQKKEDVIVTETSKEEHQMEAPKEQPKVEEVSIAPNQEPQSAKEASTPEEAPIEKVNETAEIAQVASPTQEIK